MKKVLIIVAILICNISIAFGQTKDDSIVRNKWTAHFQLTVISQSHSGFKSPYSGMNSLADTVELGATSITSTLFLGRKLWRGGAFYFNPEISGGKGLSYAVGVAGALNGETYRIGDPAPQVFVARAYLQQNIPLKNAIYEYAPDDVNQVADKIPNRRITISAGKFAISDFYDDNAYSHDPRTQFLNWSLMANGAWDYPANTRGYTYGVVAELIQPGWAVRFSSVAVPRIANHPEMEYRLWEAHSETLEAEKRIFINRRSGTIRFLVTNTRSRAPSYQEGLNAIASKDSFLLDVISGNAENNTYGGKKFGLGMSFDQELTNDMGLFGRVGWNDGKYATWAFTEIDQSFSIGLSQKGAKWKRPDDVCGIAFVSNGISKDHREFLKEGGYGFIIGDGTLNYGHESIVEAYYSANLLKFLWVSLDYQFVNNPAYNKDRGPVHVFAIRGHIQF